MSGQIRVVVVDDDTLMRDGITAILDAQADICVVGHGGDGRDAVARCRELRPDVILLDIQMPRSNGLEALAEIRRLTPGVAIMMLTTFDTGTYVDRALAAGAAGFLLKSSSYEELVAGVRSAHAGHTTLSPAVTERVVAGYLASRAAPDPADLARVANLTEREREILDQIATGASNAEIAVALHVSEHTVKTHVSHILAKTGSADRTQAAVLAHRVADRG